LANRRATNELHYVVIMICCHTDLPRYYHIDLPTLSLFCLFCHFDLFLFIDLPICLLLYPLFLTMIRSKQHIGVLIFMGKIICINKGFNLTSRDHMHLKCLENLRNITLSFIQASAKSSFYMKIPESKPKFQQKGYH